MDKIEVTTEYTYPVYCKFRFFYNCRSSTRMLVFWMAVWGIFLALTVFGTVSSVITENYEAIVYDWLIAVIIVAYAVISQWWAYRKQLKTRGKTETLLFTDEDVVMTAIGKSGQTEHTYDWRDLFCAYDTKGWFYIFTNAGEGIIVDKSKMSAQEITWLGGMLAGKLDKKYKIK